MSLPASSVLPSRFAGFLVSNCRQQKQGIVSLWQHVDDDYKGGQESGVDRMIDSKHSTIIARNDHLWCHSFWLPWLPNDLQRFNNLNCSPGQAVQMFGSSSAAVCFDLTTASVAQLQLSGATTCSDCWRNVTPSPVEAGDWGGDAGKCVIVDEFMEGLIGWGQRNP